MINEKSYYNMFKSLFIVLVVLFVLSSGQMTDALTKLTTCLENCKFELEMCATNKPCQDAFLTCKEKPEAFADCLSRVNSLYANRIVKCLVTKC
jgi:hypothetical protein